MHCSVFVRPWAVTWKFDFFSDGDGEILMPEDGPIFGWSFVEKDGPHGAQIGREELFQAWGESEAVEEL